MATALLFIGAGRFSVDARVLDRPRWPAAIGVASFVVAVAAAVWLVAALVAILSASITVAALIIVVGQLVAGLAYFLYMWRFNREVLESEA